MEKGLNLLMSTYWNGGMWKREAPTAEDYAQAIAEGYMFRVTPVRTHNETLRNLRDVLEKISPEDIANQ